ncbi:hypothetical protein VMCG_03236 [Cytospora schulzeri]|uniref:Uncharacterized protein n=1 Tax=Cytospora schulzeri TaxID=448051 RepID=A0A423WYE7_9PEZI|nr:hypothetical protein VMCG_03236 [Valsa malicola]
MKAVFVTLLSLAASAFASPVASRDVSVEKVEKTLTITTLTQQVKSYTSSINETIATVDVHPTIEIQTSLLDTLGPKLEGITDLLHSATKAAAKPAFWDGEKDQLLAKVTALVFEIVYTVKAVIAKLGLSGLLVYVRPLLIAVGGLVRSLDIVVDGLLITVQGILDTVLGAVSNTLSSLI